MDNQFDNITKLKIYQTVEGITQSELGERLGGISQSTVCRILSRKYITCELEHKIQNFIKENGY